MKLWNKICVVFLLTIGKMYNTEPDTVDKLSRNVNVNPKAIIFWSVTRCMQTSIKQVHFYSYTAVLTVDLCL